MIYGMTNECCGGYLSAQDSKLPERLCNEIAEGATSHGAEMIITACPLCRYNLKKHTDVPVYYFTELLAEALGVKEAADEELKREAAR